MPGSCVLCVCVRYLSACVYADVRERVRITRREKDLKLGRGGSALLSNIPQSRIHVIKDAKHACYFGEHVSNDFM